MVYLSDFCKKNFIKTSFLTTFIILKLLYGKFIMLFSGDIAIIM